MTFHPSPYALIHFTFIRNGNDFPPMKGREEDDRGDTCWGEKRNLCPAMSFGPTFGKCCEGIYGYF